MFLSKIIISDESWLHHFDTESKQWEIFFIITGSGESCGSDFEELAQKMASHAFKDHTKHAIRALYLMGNILKKTIRICSISRLFIFY